MSVNKQTEQLQEAVVKEIDGLWQQSISAEEISITKPPEHIPEADVSVPCFAFAKKLGEEPVSVAEKIAAKLGSLGFVGQAQAAGPFINITFSSQAGAYLAKEVIEKVIEEGGNYGHGESKNQKVMVEYVSPNTNKPLHLGHVRNQALGSSLVKLLSAAGYDVIPAIIINDRGIHICKSMLAYQRWGQGETPEDAGMKGDHFVGKYYVMFNQKFDEEYAKWAEQEDIGLKNPPEGKTKNDFFNMPESELGSAVREMLRQWEAKDEETMALWKTMNDWTIAGLKESFANFGITFDKWYFESQTCLLGRRIVEDGLKRKVFTKEDDGSVQIDLGEPLGKKVILRADGTSVYMTQDLGLAEDRQRELGLAKSIYVVGVEQNYHFQVLFAILEKLGYEWVKGLHHFSYGLMGLADGKMKSREGKVVDADDFLAGMEDMVAEKIAKREDKLDRPEAKQVAHQVALGAINFYLLWSKPVQFMTFYPEKSLSFEGSTGPYIQYTAARIKSILRKIEDQPKDLDYNMLETKEEKDLVNAIGDFPKKINQAAEKYNTSIIPHFLIDLSQQFNTFYHQHRVIDAKPDVRAARQQLLKAVLVTLENGLALLGISVPERM
ncbi:arginine--tRNA ligase [Patescibacteria group bacterium]